MKISDETTPATADFTGKKPSNSYRGSCNAVLQPTQHHGLIDPLTSS